MNTRNGTDPIVEHVREIRRGISEAAGGDMDRLAAELRRVEQEYSARVGVFGNAQAKSASAVQAGWGDLQSPRRDEIVDDVRDIRRKLATSDRAEGNG